MPTSKSTWRFAAIAILVFATLSTFCSLAGKGFLEADSCAHYLYARFAFQSPHFFVNVWGRPICTMVYAIPAAIGGRTGAHVASLLLAIACGGLAWLIARELKARWPMLALLFTLAQPLVFLHSFSELTELPFAFLLALATYCWLKDRWLLLAIVSGLLPLSRPEGFGFLILIAGLMAIRLRLWQMILLPIPLMIWSWAGHTLYNSPGPWWHWLIEQWPYSATSLYQRGSLFHFILLMPAVASPFIFPATVVGVGRMISPHIDHETWKKRLTVCAVPLMILFGHSVLYALGKMASSGEVRYMLIVAPFWGVLGAFGWERLFSASQEKIAFRFAAVAAALPILFNGYYKVLPLSLSPDWHDAERATSWYRTSGIAKDYPKFSTAQQEMIYLMDVSPTDGRYLVEWRRDLLDHPPAGTVAIYHPMYAIYNADSNRAVDWPELERCGWINMTDQYPPLGKGWRIYLSPQRADGSATPTTLHSPSSP